MSIPFIGNIIVTITQYIFVLFQKFISIFFVSQHIQDKGLYGQIGLIIQMIWTSSNFLFNQSFDVTSLINDGFFTILQCSKFNVYHTVEQMNPFKLIIFTIINIIVIQLLSTIQSLYFYQSRNIILEICEFLIILISMSIFLFQINNQKQIIILIFPIFILTLIILKLFGINQNVFNLIQILRISIFTFFQMFFSNVLLALIDDYFFTDDLRDEIDDEYDITYFWLINQTLIILPLIICMIYHYYQLIVLDLEFNILDFLWNKNIKYFVELVNFKNQTESLKFFLFLSHQMIDQIKDYLQQSDTSNQNNQNINLNSSQLEKKKIEMDYMDMNIGEDEQEDECGICLQAYNTQDCALLGCNHLFHYKCINTALNIYNNLCPICRQDVIKYTLITFQMNANQV